MSFDLSGAFGEFMSECEEITQRIYKNLSEIEKSHKTDELLDSIYRDVHTLKGSANLYGFTQLGQLAHAMEASLEPCRKKILKVESNTLDILFKCLGLIDKLLQAIGKDKVEPNFDKEISELIPHLIDTTISNLGADLQLPRDAQASLEDISKERLEKPTVQNVESQKISNSQEARLGSMDKTDIPPAPASSNPPASGNSSDASQTIRVQISRLDKLMNLIGEMVLVRNQVLQFLKNSEDSDFLKLGKRLDIVTSELQGEVMQTRMQPIGTVLEKYQRVVRDISKDLNKKIDLTLIGSETEVDKSLLEAIKDPLTHIIRNSCDHGLELPADRKNSNKSETGRLVVRSFHEGGQVVIEISDDGKGLDKNAILNKAIEKNIVSQTDAAKLSDQEIFNFIFAPGFSTAKNVTTVSGRGVGMDVVRTNVEKIGGTVELSSQLGMGTTVRLRIPLTLAIVPAMVIRVGKNRFAIPQVKLVELVRAFKFDPKNVEARNQIEYLQGKPMFRMRGHLLPLVSLKEVLKLNANQNEIHADNGENGINIAVLNGDGCLFGLIVDEIQDTTDIVVKPLSKFLKSLSVYSGATIMGDGSVVLIFDVAGIAKKAELSAQAKDHNENSHEEKAKFLASDAQEFLLFKTGAAARHAMALCLVQRLEEFDRKFIEFVGQQPVIRYRDTILPLIDLNGFLSYQKMDKPNQKEKVSVIVVQKFSKNFGIVVDEILDVITSLGMVDDTVKDRPGLLGSILHGSEVIVVVDPLDIIESEFKKMTKRHFGSDEIVKQQTDKINAKFKNLHVLFAEDTAFFRKQVVKSLESVGIKVTVAVNGKEALEKLESSEAGTFNVILSDIEMPLMNGFELATAIRRQEKFNNIPLIALTTRFKTADQEEGKRVGFALYLEKFNSDQVLSGIEKLMLEKKAA